jgi:transposase
MDRLLLTPEQETALAAQLATTCDTRLRARTLALLKVAQGERISRVARLLAVSRLTVYHWIALYNHTRDPANLADHRQGYPPQTWTPELEKLMVSALAGVPRDADLPAATWTATLLQQHLMRLSGHFIPESIIRRRLRSLGYAWKQGRYALVRAADHDGEAIARPQKT